ncbi:hypothetical protein BKA93DRAFT_829955 [Sparassis latifolia]
MESSSHKEVLEAACQAEIRKQIALLQAQLVEPVDSDTTSPLLSSSPKRKRLSGLLAPSTPSPKKRKVAEQSRHGADRRTVLRKPQVAASSGQAKALQLASVHSTAKATQPLKLTASTVLQKLANAHSHNNHLPVGPVVVRSSAFSDKAATPNVDTVVVDGRSEDCTSAHARDDRLALVEELVLGPAEHKPPFDDPHFEKLEPNSMIRLSSRSIPYEDFQDYLRGRYYLSPSKLYSVIRLLPSKQGYDVPVEGDWLTIAVVAERGKLKYSQAPVGTGRDDKVQGEEDEELDLPLTLDGTGKPPQRQKGPPRKKPKEEPKPHGKKYVNLKLIDFGCRSRGSSDNGGQSMIRGDAFLSLLLFEADGFDLVTKENGKKEKIYKGGSRGAFEKLSMLREGAVVALLNPRILKPFQRSGDAPHPTDNILAITPESVASIAVIGYSQDLGMCKVVKRDGSVCGGWCDKRVAEVCDWHIQHAVERNRAGRAEFSMGTSGMSTGVKKKLAYDPSHRWGLKPENESSGTGATYVVSGHIVSGSKDLYLTESMGRNAQAKASRKSAKDADCALRQLLKKDKKGSKALFTAREYSKQMQSADKAKGKERESEKPSKKPKAKHLDDVDSSEFESDIGDESTKPDAAKKPRKNAYSAQLIRNLGFDPTVKDGRKSVDSNVQSKLDALTVLQTKRGFALGPRPGKRTTCVHRPEAAAKAAPTPETEAPNAKSVHLPDGDDPLHIPDSSDDEDEMEKAEIAAFGKPLASIQSKVVDLDSSDGELEVMPP